VNIIEEEPDRLGRWFACYDAYGEEQFSARLHTESHELGIAWVNDLRQRSTAVATIQSIINHDVLRIVGIASNGLPAVIITQQRK
jgi:hypothetical protein